MAWKEEAGVHFEPWMLGAMEEHGYMDTKEGHIQRVARYIARNMRGTVSEAEFRCACTACNVDWRSFSQADLNRIQELLNRLS